MVPRRGTVLVLVVLVPLVGCLGVGGGGTTNATPTTTQSICTSPPEPSNQSLPERPAEYTERTVTQFAAAYEEAIVWNSMATRGQWNLSAHVGNVTAVEQTQSGYILHLDGETHYNTCLSGNHVAGQGLIQTNYFINDTVIIRLDNPPHWTTDPRTNGTVMET